MLYTVYVDATNLIASTHRRGFSGCLRQDRHHPIQVVVSGEFLEELDAESLAVRFRSQDDPGRVPLVVFEFALDVMKRLLPHLKEQVPAGDWDEYQKVYSEAYQLTLPVSVGTTVAEALKAYEKGKATGRYYRVGGAHGDPM